MIKIAIITGSTRPGRRGESVAHWVERLANEHTAEAKFELVDLADYGLPLLDELVPALFGEYQHAHTLRWAEVIGAYDGFVFVTPEYNHGLPAALKNAIDYLYAEWHHKAAGFVSYGVQGGTRAVEQLRLVLAEVKVAGVQPQVALSMFTDFTLTSPTDPGECTPADHQTPALHELLDEVIAWSRALEPLRRQHSQR
jgi:NAD(P)H-dependent FMN reductase